MSAGCVYDVAVVGLGAVGSGALYEMSKRKINCIGIEQFSLNHDQGSTHGDTRAIRKAYFEDPNYVPLLQRSYQLWEEWEKELGSELLFKTGCAVIGTAQSPVIKGCLESARTHQLSHELSSASDFTQKHPIFNLNSKEEVFFESDGGYLLLDTALKAIHQRLKKNSVPILENTQILSWKKKEQHYEIQSSAGPLLSKKIIFSMGPWASKEFLNVKLPLKVKRVVLFWFKAAKEASKMPLYFKECDNGTWFYGFPSLDNKMKVAFHNVHTPCTPQSVNRNVEKNEIQQMENYVRELIPSIGSFVEAKTCLYTMTPDEHFIVDALPDDLKNLFVVAGLSGHGFKFMPVLGEICADWAQGKTQRNSLEFLSLKRF
ncbi:MAG: N-methyl-L-tryptophan oxidase [Bdellovibrionota bacterium]